MLTPAQVKNHRFDLTGRGHYRAADVDAFFDEVYESYSQMFKENGDLVRKIGLLADKVEEYRKDEDNIRAALLTAQRMADKIVKEAKESVDGQVAEANKTAENLISEARQKSNAMLEEAKAAALESGEKAEAKAQQILAQAREQATAEAEKITADAKVQLEKMNRDIALQAVELKELNQSAAAFKADVAAACDGVRSLLDQISIRAQEELEQKVSDRVNVLAVEAEVPAQAPVDEPAPVQPQEPEEPVVQPEPEPEPQVPEPAEDITQAKKDEVQVEIDTSMVDDAFSINRQPVPKVEAPEPAAKSASGFKLNLSDLDKTADYQNLLSQMPEQSGQQLKFGDSYDIFDDDDDDDVPDDRSGRSFLNLFKK